MTRSLGNPAISMATAYLMSATLADDQYSGQTNNLPSDDEPDPTQAAMIAAEELRHQAALEALDRHRAARNFERDRLAAIRAENETRPKSRQVRRAEARAAAKGRNWYDR